MELKKITEQVYYIPSNTNIGVVKVGINSVILVDSGLDDDSGKKILKLLSEKELSVRAIVNTHSHADHCGGNRFIKAKTDAKIYAPEVESAIIRYPSLEPLYLFSGASPITDLQNKFLMAQSSDVDYAINDKERKLKFDDVELNIIPLPGHTPNQIGIEVDGILFCADSVFSEEVLSKHKIPFYTDIDRTRETLAFLRDSNYKLYIPSHAEPKDSLSNLIDLHFKTIEGIEKFLLESFHTEKTTEQSLKELCDHYQISLRDTQQYYLMNTVVMAYLSSLHRKGKLQIDIKGNSLLWKNMN